MKAGLEAQARAMVAIKNAGGVLPLKRGTKVWIPGRHYDAHKGFIRMVLPAEDFDKLLTAEREAKEHAYN